MLEFVWSFVVLANPNPTTKLKIIIIIILKIKKNKLTKKMIKTSSFV